MKKKKNIQVGVILGSPSDMNSLGESQALKVFLDLGISCEVACISAHRNPVDLAEHCEYLLAKGVHVIIAAAGMAAALPGSVASLVNGQCTVIGVALPSTEFPNAMDSLLAITRMPPGILVLCTGIGKSGLKNAAIAAAQIVLKDISAWMREHNKSPQIGGVIQPDGSVLFTES